MVYVLIFFLISFTIHILYWRAFKPIHTTIALVIIFFSTAIWGLLFFLKWNVMDPYAFWEVILCYISCSLAYICIYSAIEQQSPSLAIVTYIYQQGEKGCDYPSLFSYLTKNDEILNRIQLMSQTDWISTKSQKLYLTKSGYVIAKFFQYSSLLFGIDKGG